MHFSIFTLVLIVVCLAPFLLAAGVAWCYQHHPASPYPVAVLLGFMGAGACWCAWEFPFVGFAALLALVVGGLLLLMVATALLWRRWTGHSFHRALLFPALIFGAVFFWADTRFRIEVRQEDGAVPRIDGIDLRKPMYTPFDAYRMEPCIRFGAGTYYFGLIRWLEGRDRWELPLMITTDRRLRATLLPRATGWSSWPIRLTLPPPLPGT